MTQRTPRVLIIDNDDGLTEALRLRLESEGYECLTASSGSQGLSLFAESDFDAVITDLNMPAGDGIAVCESIQSTCRVPLIIMTGFESSYSDLLEQIGDIELIQKPFCIDSLLDELDIAIEMNTAAPDRNPPEPQRREAA